MLATKKLFAGIALLGASVVAHAVPVAVDLSDWTSQGGSSQWLVQSGNDSVLQRLNGAPTVFFDQNTTSTHGTALSGSIRVTPGGNGDDDFIGFVLGYDSGEIFSNSADYYLIDWKQGDQAGWGQGLAISHVTNGENGNTTGTSGSFWQHTSGEVDLITRANNLGNTGWVDNTEYMFDLLFTASSIKVWVDDVLEIDVNPGQFGLNAFSDGSFGFYNYSQQSVLYAGIKEEDFCVVNPNDSSCIGGNVPVPAPLTLMGLGLLGIAMRQRRKA